MTIVLFRRCLCCSLWFVPFRSCSLWFVPFRSVHSVSARPQQQPGKCPVPVGHGSGSLVIIGALSCDYIRGPGRLPAPVPVLLSQAVYFSRSGGLPGCPGHSSTCTRSRPQNQNFAVWCGSGCPGQSIRPVEVRHRIRIHSASSCTRQRPGNTRWRSGADPVGMSLSISLYLLPFPAVICKLGGGICTCGRFFCG